MRSLTYREVRERLRQGRLDEGYLFFGEEEFLRDELVGELLDQVVDQSTREFNLDRVDVGEAPPDRLGSVLRTPPLMAGRRVVVIRLPAPVPAPQAAVLHSYLESPLSTTFLIVLAERFDRRQRLAQALFRSLTPVELKPLYEELPSWVMERFRARGVEAGREVVERLIALAGDSPGSLAAEVEKIVAYLGERREVSMKDVEEVAAAGREHSVFELGDALGRKEWIKAMDLVSELLLQGESPVGVVGLLVRHYSILARVQSLGRMSRGEAASKLRVPPFFVSSYLEQAAHHRPEELARAFDALHRADILLKSSPIDPEVVLHQAVGELALGGGGRSV